MKNDDGVKIAGALGAEELRILRALPGVTVATDKAPDGHADATLYVAGEKTPLRIQRKRRVNAATARLLLGLAGEDPGLRVLVVAAETTADAREILRHAGIALVDGDGNAHVDLPGVFVHTEAAPGRARRTATPARLSGKAGAIAQTLLLDPEREWKVAELAERARCSVGLAHRVLGRLETEGVVRAEGAGPRRTRHIDNPAALLDLWAEEQHYQPVRTRAFLLAPTTRQAIDALGADLAEAEIDHALTGAAGASLVAPFVTAVPVVEVWASATEAPERLCEAVGAEEVADGHNVLFLQTDGDDPLIFRTQVEGRWVVNRFRLYADLLRSPQRGREQAQHLRAEVIGF